MTIDRPPAELFARMDEDDDRLFYELPRFVLHVDAQTAKALTGYLLDAIPQNAAVLDLMSSWVSHLPNQAYARVVCHGMNHEELAANPQATEWFVQDLNTGAVLAIDASAFDIVLISFSVQYLTNPEAVFREIGRVLRPGGNLIVAMSHRCFPTKAIRAFHVLSIQERIRFVAHCISLSNYFDSIEFIDQSPVDADPLWILCATKTTDTRSD